MAKINIKKIADKQRPANVARNDFNEAKPYDQSSTISPIGRDPDANGTIGTTVDITQRKNNMAKNSFTPTNPYTISDTE